MCQFWKAASFTWYIKKEDAKTRPPVTHNHASLCLEMKFLHGFVFAQVREGPRLLQEHSLYLSHHRVYAVCIYFWYEYVKLSNSLTK